LSKLESYVADHEGAREVLRETGLAVDRLAALPWRAVLPRAEDIRNVDLVALLRSEVSEWCKAHKTLHLDLSQVNDVRVLVHCDPRRMAKVLKSLIQNAVRAAKLSSAPKLSVSMTVNVRSVEVTLTNSGPEIDPETRKGLFKHPVRSSGNGQGVGLLIARSIVYGYGGELELISSRQDETSFGFTLPRAREMETEGHS
jgi:signal transduction histidine kinase